MPSSVARRWRWAALPVAAFYLVLLAVHFRVIVTTTYLDADAASAPVIGQLFGSAPAHASVVLGEFGWYASLLFELATKWLPDHRQLWETAPYALAVSGFALVAWSVSQIAGRWAASLTAVLLICAAPPTLHLLLSMTQHAPDWFCLALLGAFLVLVQRSALRRSALVMVALVAGAIVGVNAASDPLVVIAGLVPFVLALLAVHVLARGPDSARALTMALILLAMTGIVWVATDAVMSALNVAPEHGLDTTMLAAGDKIVSNVTLWWQSIAVLGNGDFFGRDLSFSSGLAVACAAVSIAAVVLLPRLGWREIRVNAVRTGGARSPERLAFMVFWCSSATLLSLAFVLSAAPVDIHGDRYLVGLIYAAAAVVPAVAVGRRLTEAAVVAAGCIFALSGALSLAYGDADRSTNGFVPVSVATRVARIAADNHARVGYAGYWDAAPITWQSHFRVHVYPVSVCDRGAHLCRFDLHFISSWYRPRPGARSFLLTDPSLGGPSAPTPGLGQPASIRHIGRLTMYTYRYDLAAKIVR